MILVYSENITSRLIYTLDLIFGEVCKIPYTLTDNLSNFITATSTKINYSNEKVDNALQINPFGLLSEKDIKKQSFETGSWNDLSTLFTKQNPNIPFDLFSAAFFLASRYEEYLPYLPDQHDRFGATQSLAWQNNFLNLPLIDLWCKELSVQLGIKNKCKGLDPANYRFQLTIDVDQSWTFKNKGFLLIAGAIAKSLIKFDFPRFIQQIRILLNLVEDPADTFQYISQCCGQLPGKIIYFILFGKRSRYDHNIPARNRDFQNLIQELDKKNEVGIHPSYLSNRSFDILLDEYRKLVTVLRHPIKQSRQHFLKMKFPSTYKNLIKLEISEDYTMAYGTHTGFRASIARPFYFFDLQNNAQTSLRIIPFEVMDRTLLTYLKYNPERAIDEMTYYSKLIQEVGGLFVCLWHNTSLGDQGEWKGWRKVFKKMIEQNEKFHVI